MYQNSESPERSGNVARIGAPLVEPLPPVPGSMAERFLAWFEDGSQLLHTLERRLVDTLAVDIAFCSINFDHPEYGPAARTIDLVLSSEVDARYPHEERHRRRAQVMSIPHSAMGDFPARWERGETVRMEMREMGEELGRRFEASPVKWSLSVPLIGRGEWFGLFGVASLSEEPPSAALVQATEAGAATLTASFVADTPE